MKFDAHVSNVGFILYLVARLFQSLRKQIRVLSHVFYFTFRTSRCPQCHTRNLHVRKYSKGLYKLYCPHCGLHSRWRTWRYFSNEA